MKDHWQTIKRKTKRNDESQLKCSEMSVYFELLSSSNQIKGAFRNEHQVSLARDYLLSETDEYN